MVESEEVRRGLILNSESQGIKGSDMECDRERQVKDASNVFGLSSWKNDDAL